jgi:simple sugar transport system ATP-binding protein
MLWLSTDRSRNRILTSIFETMSIAESIYLGAVAGGCTKSATISISEMRAVAGQWTKSLDIKAINQDARVVELSGGNQQKVVVAKSLARLPKLIIFDEPTRGVDVGAIAEIHQLINRIADEGLAVVVISSYLLEILHPSDRILVSRQGRIVEEISGTEATEESIMHAAVH